MAKIGTSRVLKNILATRRTGPPILPKEGFGFNPNGDPQTLPPWLPEEDLAYYASKFEKTGFTGALNYYRNMNLYIWFLFLLISACDILVDMALINGDLHGLQKLGADSSMDRSKSASTGEVHYR